MANAAVNRPNFQDICGVHDHAVMVVASFCIGPSGEL